MPQIFSEIRHAGLGEPANSEAAAIAQVHFIRVHLKNLLFGKALLEFDGNHRFREFAPPRPLVGEEKRARQLHGDRACALIVLAAVPEVRPRGACDTDEIKAPMLKKALVLRGKNCVHQGYRQVVIPNPAALLPCAVEKVRDEVRLDFGSVKFPPARERLDGSHAFPAELYG